MEDTKHTPGPWSINHPTADSKTIVLMGCDNLDGVKVCEMFIPYRNADDLDNKINRSNEAMSNAKLIAAAPELLDTLIKCHKHISFLRDSIEGEERLELDESLDSILIAIKKATE